MALDRTKRPPIYNLDAPTVPEIENLTLDNGAQLHIIRMGTQPVVKMNVVFEAGSTRATKCGIAKTTNSMLGEGTTKHNHSELSELIDFYGATIWQKIGIKYAMLNFLSLDKHTDKVLDVFEEMVKTPVFPEEQLDIYLDNERQKFEISRKKTKVIALDKFKQLLYEEGSVYARSMQLEDYDKITSSDLADYHRLAYTPTGMHMFLAGRPSDATVKKIIDMFGGKWTTPSESFELPERVYSGYSGREDCIVPTAMQASVRMGCPMISSVHPDYVGCLLLTHILGGYFGSRLMKNIREDKGWTYGIGAYLVANYNGGLLGISSDVKPDKYNEVIDEVYSEIRRLKDELVPDDELLMAKNVIKGSLIAHYESMLSSVEVLEDYILDTLPVDFDVRAYSELDSLTSEQLRDLARKYYDEDKFVVVAVRP